MPEIKHLVPAAGITVIRPDTLRMLPPKGEPVEMNSYWRRRLKDGDVTEQATPPKSAKASAQEKTQ